MSQVLLKTSFENGAKIKNNPTTYDDAKYYLENYWLRYFNVANVVHDNGFAPYPEGNLPYMYYLNGEPEVVRRQLIQTDYGGGISRFFFITTDGILYFMMVGHNGFCGDDNTFIVDLNSYKGPNFFGKDVFYFCANLNKNTIYAYGNPNVCKYKNDSSHCTKKIMQDNWQIKSDYPW